MIIDSHAHIYPDKLARKAARSIGDFYDIDMDLDGTVDMLLKVGDDLGYPLGLLQLGKGLARGPGEGGAVLQGIFF